MKIQAVVVGIATIAYIVAAIVLYFANQLYMLPSYDSSSYSFYSTSVDAATIEHNFSVGAQIGLAYFCFALLIEVVVFLWTFRQIKEVKEFNFTPEMVYLCTVWVVSTNVYLFLVIQGSYSSWFSIT